MIQTARRRRLVAVLFFLLSTVCALIVIFPYYWMIMSSIAPKSQFDWPPDLFPREISLDAYRRVFAERPIGEWFINTGIVAVSATVLCTVVAVNAGYALSRFRGKLPTGFGIFILVSQMVPAALLAVPLYIVYRQIGLYNNLVGLAIADSAFVLPLSTWLMRGFFDAIPIELEQQAEVDGCTKFGAFYRITLPLALPGIVVVMVFAFMAAWDEFFLARTLTSSQSNWVLSVGLTSLSTEIAIDWEETMAASVVFALPAAILFLFVQRYLVGGLTGGAVKG